MELQQSEVDKSSMDLTEWRDTSRTFVARTRANSYLVAAKVNYLLDSNSTAKSTKRRHVVDAEQAGLSLLSQTGTGIHIY